MSAKSKKIPVCGPKYSLFSGFLDSASQILFKFGIELNALISELDIDISVFKIRQDRFPFIWLIRRCLKF